MPTSCLGRFSVSPARGDGDGHTVSPISRLWISGGSPWRFTVPLLRVKAVVAENQPLSQRDRRPFSTDVLASLTLFLLVLLKPAVSRDVRPTPGIPAGVSLSFVFLTPPAAAASCPHAFPELPVLVWFQ